MIARRASLRCLATAAIAVSLAGAAAADTGVDVRAASVPAGMDARYKQALSRSVKAQIGAAGFEAQLKGYSVLPALVELRRFIEPGQKQARTICVVDLGLHNNERGLVANVRGTSASFSASQLE